MSGSGLSSLLRSLDMRPTVVAMDESTVADRQKGVQRVVYRFAGNRSYFGITQLLGTMRSGVAAMAVDVDALTEEWSAVLLAALHRPLFGGAAQVPGAQLHRDPKPWYRPVLGPARVPVSISLAQATQYA